MSCPSCGTSYKSRQHAIDDARTRAKQKAIEDKKPYAVCEEESDGTIFIADAFTAFAQNFKRLDIISGLTP